MAGFWVALSVSGLLARTPRPHAAYVTAQIGDATPYLKAYGQVVPVTVLPVRAAESGVLAGLRTLPGTHVQAGQELGHLEGPEIQSMLSVSQANVRSAHAQLVAARKSLAILRQQLACHLTTREMVHQAESAVAQALANSSDARSHLKTVRQMTTISAPSSGIVLNVTATDGELLSAGQVILSLQTTDRLWLKAVYYGVDITAIRPGMTGVFSPAGGSPAIQVRVSTVFGSLTAGGGESIGLVPRTWKFNWVNGEYGTVTINLRRRALVMVPTRSLILSQGKWYVMVHTARGDHPQAVVPGPARGWATYLERGLKAGEQVVVENAYLLFHRGIAKRYQPPD